MHFTVTHFIQLCSLYVTSAYGGTQSICDHQLDSGPLVCSKRPARGFVQDECPSTMDVNDVCCFDSSNNTHVAGIDLRGCSIEHLNVSFFADDTHLAGNLEKIEDLSLNPNLSWDSDETFRGLSGLLEVNLDKGIECPGGDESWNDTTVVGALQTCKLMNNYCSRVKNFKCPSSATETRSECHSDGPGLLQCLCAPGYHGYKCLQKGEFPYVIFFVVLTVVTVLLSVFLWYTQRRHTRKVHTS